MISRKELSSYLDRGWTTIEIAEICGCSKGTVRRKAKEYGLQVRRPLEPEKVLAAYQREGSIAMAGEALGVTGAAVSKVLRKHYPGYSGSKGGFRYSDEDREKAMRLYVDDVEIDDICAEIGCSRTTVTKWAQEDGIGRGAGRRRSYRVSEAVELVEKLGTMTAAADVLGVSPTSVHRALKEARCQS